jgi:hypothetical protein
VLKTVLLGIWVIAVTAAATYGSIYLKDDPSAIPGAAREDHGLEALQSEMTSVPIIRGGEVIGYLIIKLVFEADKSVLAEKMLEPIPFLNDAAFRVIFARTDIDFRRLRPSDLDRLTADIASEANKRIGAELVRHVLLEELNYVRKEDIRTNWIGGQKPGQ